MKVTEKKKLELAGVCVLLAALAIGANVEKNNNTDTIDETEGKLSEESKNEIDHAAYAEWNGTEIDFWYKGEEYEAFFEQCAKDFEAVYGVKVNLSRRDSLNYEQNIYQSTIDEAEGYPDVFFTGADQLRKFKLAMVAAEVPQTEQDTTAVAENALAACTIEDTVYGYPLSGNTYVFVYQKDFFEKEPASFAELLDFALENDPGEGIEKLLEWDLSDGYCNFTFAGDAIAFEESDNGLEVTYQEEKYRAGIQAFQNLSAMIALEDNETEIIESINEGTLLTAILPSDAIASITNEAYSIGRMPDITEEIPSVTAAQTDILVANALSEQAETGAAFAAFVCNMESEYLMELSGKLSVHSSYLKTEEENTCFEQYEASRVIPDTLDHTDFWIDFQKQMEDYWNGEEIDL